jgi:hypothetical protein
MTPSKINELQKQVIGVVHEAAPQLADIPLDGLFRGSKVVVVGVRQWGILVAHRLQLSS